MERVERRRWMRKWGTIAWWIVVCYSVPFSLYTLGFVSGKFEIYKHLTLQASFGNYDLAGLHIARHVRTWQIHAAAALLFMIIGPLQFHPSFRNKYPVVHRQLGYVFAVCTVITAVTGATTMRTNSELGPLACALFPAMSIGSLITLTISIIAARNRNFQSHRRWMLRSAAIGYSVMYTRLLPKVIGLIPGVTQMEAVDYSFPVSIALNSGLAEIYIQLYLTQSDRKASPKPAAPYATLTDTTTKKVS